MKRYLLNYINENIRSIVIFSALILIGILVGIISLNLLSQTNKVEMINSVKGTLDLSKQADFNGINVLKNGLTLNLFIISIIVLAVFTLIAPIIICIIYVLKGFSLGLYIAIIYSIFGFLNGSLVLLLAVIIPNIIYLPSLIYIGVNAINFHYEINPEKNVSYTKSIVKHSYQLLISIAIIIVSIVIEQSLSPVIFSIYSKI